MLPALSLALALAPAAEATRRSTVHAGDWAATDFAGIQAFCRRYDRVDGDLVVGPDYRSQDLRALDCLVGVSGAIRIERAPLLRSLDGLERLISGDGLPVSRVVLRDNPALHDASQLAQLSPVGLHHLEVVGNPRLTALVGLPPVLAGGSLVVSGNATLAAVVLGDAATARSRLTALELRDNPVLVRVAGLRGVTTIDTLRVEASPALVTLDVAPDLQAVGALRLAGLPELAALPPWPALSTVDRWELVDLDRVTALPEAPTLYRVKHLELSDNAALVDLSGLLGNRRSPPTLYGATVRGNGSLDPDHARAVFDRLDDTPGAAEWVIEGNGADR